MDTDIRDEIERSFGTGPADDPAGDPARVVELGRRALRRRRLTEGASMVAVAAVAVAAALVTTSGSADDASPPPVVTSPTVTPSRATDLPPSATLQPYDVVDDEVGLSRGVYADMGADGVVHVRPGAEVVTLLRNPWHLNLDGYAVAVAVRYQGDVWWAAIAADDGGGSGTYSPALPGVTFEEWVADNPQDISHGDGDAPPAGSMPGDPDLDLVRFVAGTQRLRPTGVITIQEQRPHPQVGASFAGPGDRTAVAAVTYNGEPWYVLARDPVDGPPQYIAVHANDGGPTLDDFLDFARERYAEGGGGLL